MLKTVALGEIVSDFSSQPRPALLISIQNRVCERLSCEKSKSIVYIKAVEGLGTVKLGNKERFDKEQIGIKELFMDYQPFYTINLLLDKELLPI